MNEIDPRLRYSPDTVRKFADGVEPSAREKPLDPLVERIAAEYKPTSISPIMVSGFLRIGEFFQTFLHQKFLELLEIDFCIDLVQNCLSIHICHK